MLVSLLGIWVALMIATYAGNYRLVPFLTTPPLLYLAYRLQTILESDWRWLLVFLLSGVFVWLRTNRLLSPWLLWRLPLIRRLPNGEGIVIAKRSTIEAIRQPTSGFPFEVGIRNGLPSTLRHASLSISFEEEVRNTPHTDLGWTHDTSAQGTIFWFRDPIANLANGAKYFPEHALGLVFLRPGLYRATYRITADNFNSIESLLWFNVR